MNNFKWAIVLLISFELLGCKTNDASFETIAQMQELATQAYINGDLHSAEGLWSDVVRVMPEHSEAWCQLGHIHYRLHRYTAANNAYQKCLSITPENIAIWHNLTAAKLRDASETLLSGSAYLTTEHDQVLVGKYQLLLRELLRLHGIADGLTNGANGHEE